MKYLLALLILFMLPLTALADAPYDRHEAGFQRVSHNYAHERALRREYEAWRAARLAKSRRAARLEEARLRRYEVLERAEAAERRRLRNARLRRQEALYETRAERAARFERELRAENRRYASQRRAAGRTYSDESDVEEREYSTRRDHIRRCMPAVTAWGPQLLSRARAELFARKAWVGQVETTHNRRYADPARAENKRYLCDRDPTTRTPQYICRFRATPCRGEL